MRKPYLKYRPAILYLLLLHCVTGAFAQSKAWSYQYYNSYHGLPSSEIIALAKDSKGFLWVGTSSGLAVYDGYNFHNYSYTNTNELIGHVNTIKPGNANSLWIGSDAGLFWYADNKMIKLSAALSLPQGVNDILPGENNILWLATENGPVKIDTKNIDFTGVKKIVLADHVLKQWKAVAAERRCLLIAKAPDNTIYIAQYANLFRLLNNQLELIHSTNNSRDKINTLFPVSRSKIYFDAAASELNAIDNGKPVAGNPEELYQQDNNNTAGTWYIGTRGAYYFHPETGTVSEMIHFSDKYLVWPTAVLKDTNFLWLASQDGLIKLKPALFAAHDLPASSFYNDYYAVTALKNGNLLLGANRGRIFEKKDNGFVLVKDRLVPDAEIKALYEDERGRLWVATGYQGLVLIQNGITKHFTIDNGLHDNTLLSFLKTSNGKLYVLGDRGMSEVIINSDNSIAFRKFLYTPNSTAYAKCFAAIESPDGSLWIGSEEGLLHFKNDSLQKITLSGKQLYINFLLKDQEGKVWIATSGDGILQAAFNKKNELEIIKQFTEDDGLNSTHYLTLLADKENNIWAGSSKGLSLIGQQGKYKNRILNFDESDGFIKPGYSYIRLYEDSNDTIWAATTFGFKFFKPGTLLSSDVSPVVYITGISEIKRNELVTGKKLFQFPGKNEFPYSSNSFSFQFTALDYANQENIRYYYKLDGLDSNWINAGKLRSISFENLSPGKYSFRVKALNGKGSWSKQDAAYTFTIIPPFWKTWWFLLLLLTAMAAAFYFFIRRREKIIRGKEKQKMELLKLNKDLATSQLTALRAQMNPHFIFNALNSVQQYILQGNVIEANKYLSKFSRLQREILNNSNQNFILLQKEMEMLSLYLELEQLRFAEKFTYTITKDEAIDEEEIKIPPMIIQPFIENAIWHGLMPKAGDRFVKVHFSLPDEDQLVCTITDNGIGRDAAARLRQASNNDTVHKSKGLSLVYDRLNILQAQYGKPFTATITDLSNEDGSSNGTKVTLTIYLDF